MFFFFLDTFFFSLTVLMFSLIRGMLSFLGECFFFSSSFLDRFKISIFSLFSIIFSNLITSIFVSFCSLCFLLYFYFAFCFWFFFVFCALYIYIYKNIPYHIALPSCAIILKIFSVFHDGIIVIASYALFRFIYFIKYIHNILPAPKTQLVFSFLHLVFGGTAAGFCVQVLT